MNKFSQKEFLIILVLTLFTLLLMWFVGYDSMCSFTTDCNRGINPTTLYGFKLFPLKKVGLYTGAEILPFNILLTCGIVFFIYLGVILLKKRFTR